MPMLILVCCLIAAVGFAAAFRRKRKQKPALMVDPAAPCPTGTTRPRGHPRATTGVGGQPSVAAADPPRRGHRAPARGPPPGPQLTAPPLETENHVLERSPQFDEALRDRGDRRHRLPLARRVRRRRGQPRLPQRPARPGPAGAAATDRGTKQHRREQHRRRLDIGRRVDGRAGHRPGPGEAQREGQAQGAGRPRRARPGQPGRRPGERRLRRTDRRRVRLRRRDGRARAAGANNGLDVLARDCSKSKLTPARRLPEGARLRLDRVRRGRGRRTTTRRCSSPTRRGSSAPTRRSRSR